MYVPKILYEVNTLNKYTQKNSILKKIIHEVLTADKK